MSNFISGNSVTLQVLLIVIAIVTNVFVIGNYPDPKPPVEDALPFYLVTIYVWDMENSLHSEPLRSPAVGIDIGFYVWNDAGPTEELSITSNSNASGIVEVLLEEGTYDMKVSEWTTETLDIMENLTLTINHHVIENVPSSIEILALSNNWKVTSGDIISVSFTNPLMFPAKIESVTMGEAATAMTPTSCEVDVDIAVDAYGAAALGLSSCDGDYVLDLQPFESWSDSFRVPAGVSIPWQIARSVTDVVLRYSYTEVLVDE
tara:strand:- start:1193 stop:1975 length:783 start_codon:yes stop_codon:yes gene_type:complete